MSLLTTLGQLGAWNWLLLAIVLFALEAMVPGIHFVWFGVAAILVGLFGLATNFAWQWQLAMFAVVSVATVFATRRLARSDASPSDLPNLNVRGQQYVGRVFTVEEAIQGGRGKVRVADSLWQAEGADAPAGSRVKVTGVRDTVLLVAPQD
jgi:membrane protein implicated in regulation of membrane protease activity